MDEKLQTIMKDIYRTIYEASETAGKAGNFVLGANVAGLIRVANAMIWQGA